MKRITKRTMKRTMKRTIIRIIIRAIIRTICQLFIKLLLNNQSTLSCKFDEKKRIYQITRTIHQFAELVMNYKILEKVLINFFKPKLKSYLVLLKLELDKNWC